MLEDSVPYENSSYRRRSWQRKNNPKKKGATSSLLQANKHYFAPRKYEDGLN